MRSALLAQFALLSLLALPASPHPASAQADSAAPAAATVAADSLVVFVRTHLAVAKLREQAQAELAEPKNKKEEEQLRLREQLRTRVAEALREHGLTPASFDAFTRLVSTDDAVRKAFEAEMARQGAKP
jgi:hypothetical protein